MLVYKCKHNVTAAYLQELLLSRQHTEALRSFNTDYMDPSSCSNTLVKNSSFSSAGPRTWNSLPAQIKTASSLESFKKALKAHLFKSSYGDT